MAGYPLWVTRPKEYTVCIKVSTDSNSSKRKQIAYIESQSILQTQTGIYFGEKKHRSV